MFDSLKNTGLVLVLLIGMVLGLSTVAIAQDGDPDDDPSEDVSESEGVDDDQPDGTDDPDGDEDGETDDDDGSDDDGSDDDDADGDEDDDDGDDNSPRNISSARVFGADRIATSVAISQYEFRNNAREVYLAQADNFADAVAAGPLSRGPVLLVPNCGDLPAVVADEITRLSPHKVVALGGVNAICDDMIAQAVDAATRRGHDTSDDTSNDTDPDGPRTENEQDVELAVGQSATFDADVAGTVTITRNESGIELVEAAPAEGWTIRESDDGDPGEAEVSFTDGSTRVDFSAEVDDGSVRIRVRVRTR